VTACLTYITFLKEYIHYHVIQAYSPTFSKHAHPFSTTWSDCWLLLPSHKLFRTTQYEKATGTELSSHIVEKVSNGNRFTMETWKLEDEPLDLK
jgi:hypothetical protein